MQNPIERPATLDSYTKMVEIRKTEAGFLKQFMAREESLHEEAVRTTQSIDRYDIEGHLVIK